MTSSPLGRSLNFLLRELIGEILFFPVWWYSQGLVLAWRRMLNQWNRMYQRSGLRFLLTNMGKPMYGDYSRSGKVISFFFRLLLVFWWVVVLALWGVLTMILFLLWVLAPIVTIGLLVYHLLPHT